MSKIERQLKNGEPTGHYGVVIKKLAQKLLAEQDDVVFFLGAGVAFDATQPHLPTGSDLSRDLAAKCGLQWYKYVPLSTVASYYEFFSGRDGLNTFLRQNIADTQKQPSGTIRKLVDLIALLEQQGRETLIATTNYDTHFELAYHDKLQARPSALIYDGGTDANDRSAVLHPGVKNILTWRPPRKTVLYKIHGCISRAEGESHNLVITEEDYINFLSNSLSYDENKRPWPYLMGKIADSTLLFIGYSLTDWNFRVIFKATAEKLQNRPESYAVQLFTDQQAQDPEEVTRWDTAIGFWDRKRINIINAEAELFVADMLWATRAVIKESQSPSPR